MGEIARLHEEHHDLRQELSELRAVIEGDLRVPADRLAERLEGFLLQLRSHFSFEEEGGLFADIAAQRPSFDRRVTQLMRQHPEIEGRFAAAHQVARGADEVAAVVEPLESAMALLLEHEREEIDLVQEAAMTDIGGGD